MRWRPTRAMICWISGWLLLSCTTDVGTIPDDAVAVGLLLPFTGADAAVGSNYEYGAILAREAINDSGGILGRPMAFFTKDTHSTPERALSSIEALLQRNVPITIGPEGAEIARTLLPGLYSEDTTILSPLISGAGGIELPADYTWVRLAPSSRILGRAFANYLIDQNVRTLNVVYSSEDYHMDFAASVIKRFTERGGVMVASLHISPGQSNFSDTLKALSASSSDHILLSASAGLSARLVNDVTVSLTKRSQSWFLSPLLATPVFLLNTYNNAVEGAVGIAPAVTHPDPEFISRYRKRWNVDPDDGAFFYYDAAAIAALAMADALRRHGAFPDRQQVTDSVLNVCSPRGVQIAWNEMEKGLDNIAAGKTIYYKGLTGPFLLDAFDNPGQQMAAPMKIWGIRDGVIVDHEKL